MHIQNFNLLRIYALATLLLSSIVFSDEPLVIDVRSLEEVKTGIIQDAIHIEWTQIDEEINNIKKELTENFGTNLKRNFEHDPSLIGGLIIQIGSVMIDTSIKSKLQQLETKMIEA